MSCNVYTVHTFNLVPFLFQNTELWISNHHRAGEQEGAEEALQSLPVDSWEIPPDCIIMDTKLGEGEFGGGGGVQGNAYEQGHQQALLQGLRVHSS